MSLVDVDCPRLLCNHIHAPSQGREEGGGGGEGGPQFVKIPWQGNATNVYVGRSWWRWWLGIAGRHGDRSDLSSREILERCVCVQCLMYTRTIAPMTSHMI